MTGGASLAIVIIMRLQRAKSASTSAASAMARISLRSWPEQNPRPFAASTTAPMPRSATTRSSVPCISSMSAPESALNWPGRLSVRVATPSVVSKSSRLAALVVVLDVMGGPPAPMALERDSAWDQPMFKSLSLEILPEVRGRDSDECLVPLRHRLALQVHDAVLGDDVHHIGAWRGHDVSLREIQHDPAAT